MRILVNGDERDVRDRLTVADLVRDEGLDDRRARGVAVAIDAEVVPKSEWGETEIAEGQRVEVLSAMQGG